MSAKNEVVLRWITDESFEVLRPGNFGGVLDGHQKEGASPMDCLLVSLCACMGIDVVLILTKMRAPLQGLEIHARGHRRENPPRSFSKIELDFRVQGEIRQKDLNRAIDLSFEKYCSVWHSLRPDLEIERRVLEA